ncbi:MAG: hypothetical protein ACRD1K_18065 [Acidimicrobiales bacterium]
MSVSGRPSRPSGEEGEHADRPRGIGLGRMLTVTDETDRSGRLLLEDSAPKRGRKDAQRRGIKMKSVRCTYQDSPSRLGGDMNTSAFEALRHDTADVLNGFAWLHRHYAVVNPAGVGTVRALFETSYLGLSLPLVLFHRAEDPVARQASLATFVASIFKASRGVFSAAVDMGNKRGPTTPVTAADILAFADAEGHLARPQTGRVCAAPSRLIERTLSALLTGEGADPDRSGLEALVDFGTLWDFFGIQDSISQALSDYRYLLDQAAGGMPVADPRELFGRSVRDGGTMRSFGECSATLVDRANTAQRALNLVLGRAPEVAELDYKAVLRLL